MVAIADMTDDELDADIALHANKVENAAQALMRRTKEKQRRKDAPAPAPSPTPAPAEILIDGAAASFAALETVDTQTGRWPLRIHYGAGFTALLFGLESDPAWWSVCIAQYADPAATQMVEAEHTVTVGGKEHLIRVFTGSIKLVEPYAPIKPEMARLAAAVADGEMPPYSRAAFEGWPQPGDYTNPGHVYRPDRIYGKSSGVNAIGDVSSAGGEQPSSRGFLSSTDARMIVAALEGDQATFDAVAEYARVETYYGLSLPNLAIWAGDHLRDPQHPFEGDKPYVNEGSRPGAEVINTSAKWIAPADYPYLDEIGAVAGEAYSHKRDLAHLFNHGLAYWFATGDPRAAMLQQAIAAFALAAPYQGPPNDTDYAIRFGYQRTTLNCFTAMWKLGASRKSVTGDKLLWPLERCWRMMHTVLDDWERKLAAMDASTDPKAQMMSAFKAIDNGPSIMSDFMNQDYGPEAAWLWASAGRGALLTRLAENMVIRVVRIGGARGVDNEGSNLFVVDGSATTLDELIAEQFDGDAAPAESLDTAAAHTAMRAYWLLRFAQDAVARGWIEPVADLDKAVTLFQQWRDAGPALRYTNLMLWDHAAVPRD